MRIAVMNCVGEVAGFGNERLVLPALGEPVRHAALSGVVRGVVEQWGYAVAIGEVLAEARHRAGLSVAQVSERTRIREPVVRGIEDGDYTACGGDFYARGHIRAIAEVVHMDSAPLIREYDRVHRAPGMVSRVSLDELLATSAQAPHRRQPSRPAAAGLVASARSAWHRLNLQAAWTAIAAFCARALRKEVLPAGPEAAVATRASASRRRNWAGVLGLAVAVALGFAVYRVLTVPPHAAVIPPTGQAATDHPARHARPDQAPYTSHGSGAPSLAPAVPAQKPSPIHAAASSAGNLAHRPADRRSARGPLAPRLTSQRRLQEPAHGHAPASGHEPPGHGRRRPDHLAAAPTASAHRPPPTPNSPRHACRRPPTFPARAGWTAYASPRHAARTYSCESPPSRQIRAAPARRAQTVTAVGGGPPRARAATA